MTLLIVVVIVKFVKEMTCRRTRCYSSVAFEKLLLLEVVNVVKKNCRRTRRYSSVAFFETLHVVSKDDC